MKKDICLIWQVEHGCRCVYQRISLEMTDNHWELSTFCVNTTMNTKLSAVRVLTGYRQIGAEGHWPIFVRTIWPGKQACEVAGCQANRLYLI
jgi:hypothetical protein